MRFRIITKNGHIYLHDSKHNQKGKASWFAPKMLWHGKDEAEFDSIHEIYKLVDMTELRDNPGNLKLDPPADSEMVIEF